MAARIVVYLLKALGAVVLFFGRALVFNWDAPRIGRHIGNLRYGPDKSHRMDAYLPRGDPPYPILVFLHGGGWITGNKEAYARICRSFAARGYLVFCVTYRLAPRAKYPAGMQDTAAAVRWIYDHAWAFGGLRSTVFLAGDSAGAHLACWYATALAKPELLAEAAIDRAIPRQSIRGLLLFYGVYDVRQAADARFPFVRSLARCLLGDDPELAARRARAVSPICHVGPGAPPMLLCAGEPDLLHGQSIAMADVLRRHGVPHRLLIFDRQRYPAAHHAFLNFYSLRCARIAMQEALRFMDALRCDGNEASRGACPLATLAPG